MIVRKSATYLRMVRGAGSMREAVRGVVGGTGAPRDRNRHRLRPACFLLEDRRLLSVFSVDSIADSAPASDPAQGTLRWAVEQANAAATPSAIEFNLGSAADTVTLAQGQLVLSNSANAISIYDGPGEGAVTISGNNASRVFWVDDGVTVSMSDLTITGGKVGNFNAGAGLNNDGGTVTLTDCTITGNSALFISDNGIVNGFYNSTGGGLYNDYGTVNLTDSTISGNYAYAGGGGLDNKGGTTTLTECTVSGNSAHLDGGGIDNGSFGQLKSGGLGWATGSVGTFTGCAISGNSSASYGSGLVNYGTAALTNCTVTNGSAYRGGGTLENNGTETLSGCTISGNTGSGLENGDYFFRSASLDASNCTISSNTLQGVDSLFGTSTLTNCVISGNGTTPAGVARGGGVDNDSTAYLTGCTITDNQSDFGAGVENDGKAELTGCTISGNSANVGAVDNEDGSITLTACTISGNSGTGLVDSEATAVIVNSTISGNSTASAGGGVDNYGGSTATLTDCTISGNSGKSSGGLYDAGGGFFSSPSTATLTSTIIASNTASGKASDISGTDVTGTYNLIGTGGSGGLSNGTDGNIVGVSNPLLAPLGNYGGPTQTMALLPGSPAIGAGTGVSLVTTDQRGAPRATSGSTDIGAFQDEGYALIVSSGSGQSATVGQSFAAPLVAGLVETFADAPLPGATIAFSAPATGASATLSASAVVTNANGLASVTATANSIAGAYAVTATATDITSSASFSLTNTPSGPVNVTSDLSVQFGGFAYNRTSRQFTQKLTVKNVGSAAIAGPIELVLLNLKNATLLNENGMTQGNPYITILSSGSLGVGQSLSATLVFSDPTLGGISYTTEFLAGSVSSDDQVLDLQHDRTHLKGDHS
jgi:hypothetical protein